ncbi:hypothetical protein [Pseudorhizobium flavum]|uniref:hypothetical protein n=1 Tax=Pseudorhizobium flavum TaxID=1335061 RepID=UPI00376FDF44
MLYWCKTEDKLTLSVLSTSPAKPGHSEVSVVQFASLPDRAEPDQGEFDILAILREIVTEGYAGFLGAEYKQKTGSFDWMACCKKTDV